MLSPPAKPGERGSRVRCLRKHLNSGPAAEHQGVLQALRSPAGIQQVYLWPHMDHSILLFLHNLHSQPTALP